MRIVFVLTFALLMLFCAPLAEASHGRGSSASYTISSAGLLTLECYSVWEAGSADTPTFQIYTGTEGSGTLVGTMTLASTTNPVEMGVELDNRSYRVRKDTYTFNLSGQPSGTYYARWFSGNRISGISNITSSSSAFWEIELVVKYTANVASGGPRMSAANMEPVLAGFNYNHDLGATDPDGSAVTFAFLTGIGSPDYGSTTLIPGINVSGGILNIPAANTAVMATGRYHYKVRATDASGATSERDVLVYVNPLSISTTTTALAYDAEDPAIAIDPALTVVNIPGGNITSATVSISGNYASGQDILEFTDQNGLTGSFNASTGILTLTGSATTATYQTALRSVTYRNSSATPSILTRTVSFRVSDGSATSNPATRSITVTGPIAFPIIESFDGKTTSDLTANDWLINGNATATANALRLTPALDNQNGSAIYNRYFNSALGINVQFDYYIDGGNGADGMSFFLLNGSQSSPTAGALGGALGYVYRDSGANSPGASQAYMGVGFDVWGNFLNRQYFHDGLGNGLQPNRIGIRGPATISNSTRDHDEYDYVIGSGKSYDIEGSRKVNLTIKNDGTISMQISRDAGATWDTVYDNLNYASSTAFSGYSTPATFKLGFAASTGGANNEHRIDNLRVTIPADLAVAFTSSPSGRQLVGATVNYTVTMSNSGPNADPAAQFDYVVPAGISGVTWSYSVSGGGATGNGTGNSISTALNLPVGSTATFNISGTVASSAAGQTLTHTATAVNSSGYGDPSQGNRSATVTTTVNAAPTLTSISTLVGTVQDTPFTISYATLAAAANESDADGDTITFRIESVTSGTLTKNGSQVTAGSTTIGSGENVIWTPGANASGEVNAFKVVASDGSVVSSSEVQVKVQVAALATFPIAENFNSKTSSDLTSADWIINGNATVLGDRLRLTPALNNQNGSAIYNRPFSSSLGINVQFDYFMGSGTGADGMSFYLLDGAVFSPTTGSGGGALNYTYNANSQPGVSKGYLGLGFDYFGNFLNAAFFGSGVGSSLIAPVSPKTIALRGPGTANPSYQSNGEYDYVVGSAFSFSQMASDTTWRKVNLTLKNDGTVTMQVSTNNGATWTTVYDNLDFEGSAAFGGYTRPATFKFGFGGSTGGFNNDHSIDNLRVTIPVDLSVAFTSSPSGLQAIGATVNYVVTVTNNGPNPDSSAQFSYTVPSGITGVTWSYSIAGGGGSGTGNGSGNTISTTLNLPVGATATFTVSGTVDASVAGETLTHTASATPSSGAGDPTLNNRTATVTTEISDVPVISGMVSSVAFQENSVNASAEVIDSSVTISDEENNYNGGNVSLSYTSGGGSEDQLTIRNHGSGAGEIGFAGGTVTFGGVTIGTVPSSGAGSGLNGQSLVVTLNSNATVAATEALLENLAYRNSSDTPTASRTVSLKVNDGVGGESLPHSIVITVNAQNDVPTLSAISLLTGATEDTPFTITFNSLASAGNESDPEGASLSFRIESVSSGVLTKGGVAVTPGVTILATSESLSWTPDANANGTLQAFSVRAYDGTDVSSTAIPVEVSVAAVNDVPSFAKGANQAVLEDAGAQTVTGWATGMSVGPANEAGQTLSFQLSNDNNALFSTQPSISADGTLTYTPAANANGTATVTVAIKDDGGTANSGSDTSASQTFTISVTAVNDMPLFTKGADQSVLEDAGVQTVTGWATAISPGPANESAQSVSFEVSNDNTALFSTQPAISAAGTLTYTPAANANGSASVTVVIKDDGGTANSGSDTSAVQTFTISVTAVNDIPSFTKGSDQTVLEDAGGQVVTGWATGMSVGPANEAGQTLSFQLSNDNNGLFSAQPSISADGTLTYTPAANANGSATVTVSIKDDGGTANSGSDTSTIQSFTISVTPVNDAPTLGVINDQTILEDASAQSVILGGIATGANNESQALIISVTSSDPTLIPHPVVAYNSPSDTATLTFQPVANGNGVVTVTVTVADDGGIANGGVQQSTRTFTITLTPVNDAPTLGAIANPAAILEDASQQTISFTGVATGQPNEVQTLSVIATSSNPSLIPNPSVQYISPQGQGTLTYTPVPDANGTATITVIVSDDAGTANGGVHAVTNTFDVVVIPVNDVPTLNVISNLTMTEDGNPHGVNLLNVTAGGGENQILTVSVFASNRELFSEVELDYTSPNASGSITLYPALNAFGTSTIFVTVRDDGDQSNGGENTLTRSFEVTMKPVNDAPTLVRVKTLEGAIEDTAFSVSYDDLLRATEAGDIESDPLQFRIEAVNNGTVSIQGISVIPGQTLLAAGSQLVWTPSLNTNGLVQAFTVRVWDGQAQSRTEAPVSIVVAAVNDAPTINNLAESITINEDTPAMIDLVLRDVDTPASRLQMTVLSSNTNLVSDTSILPSNNDEKGMIFVIPNANQFGEVKLAISVSDPEGLVATNSISLKVNSVNDAPVLTSIGTLTNAFSGLPFEVAYDSILAVTAVSDVEGDPISFRLEEIYVGALTNELREVALASLLSTNQTWTWFTDTNGIVKAFAVRAFDGKDMSLDGLPISIDVRPTIFADAKLVASDGLTKDLFGYAVAVDNGTIALGAPQAAAGGKNGAGAAYVFRRNGTNWLERSKLVPNDGREFDRFGSSIAISGNILVAGAHQAQVSGQEAAGAAYVFARSGTNWVQRAKLVASDAIEFDRFGSAVAISGDTVVVGAPQAIIDGQEAAGAVYVFTRSGTVWTETAKLVPSKSALQDWFGLSVAISGDTIVVGALLEDLPNKRDAGAAYVFQRSGTNWTEQARLIAGDAQQFARFGSSVAISGNRLVVGASLTDSVSTTDSGAAYVFTRDGGQWKEEAKLVSFYEEADEWFGSSVSISTNTVIIGSIQSRVGRKTFAGSAYKFVWDGSAWAPRARLMALDLEPGDRYGSAVAVSGEISVVSTFMSDPAAKIDAGAAYVFSAGAPPDTIEEITVTDLEPPGPEPAQASTSRQVNVATRLAGETSCVVSANYLQGEGYRVVVSGPIGQRVRLLCSEDFRRWTVLKVFTLGPFPSEYLDSRPFRDAGRYYKVVQEPDSRNSGELRQVSSGERRRRDEPMTARE